MSALEDRYKQALQEKSPIQEHLATLRAMAQQCKHVTEFGAGLSTIALLAGRPDRLVSYDVLSHKDVLWLAGVAESPFEFIEANTLDVIIEPTEMLFIDTKHTAEQIYAELTNNGDRVRRWIVLHDTVSCGDYDQAWPGPPLGILWGLGRYLLETPETWRILRHDLNGNGLMVLERL